MHPPNPPHRITTLQFVLPSGQSIDEDTQPAWNAEWTPNNNPQDTIDIMHTDVQTGQDGSTIVTATTIFKDLGACNTPRPDILHGVMP